ncbi:MAG: STAS domain-containing protein [Clostridia bacterium]|nr:STAS domain-containing protein [Clostridia bacterium]
MTIKKEFENGILTIYPEGKIDTSTAPEAEIELKDDVAAARKLVIDLTDLEYLSSAGLRLLLRLNKTMAAKDGMIVKNVNDSIMEIIEITGFTSILQIEE